MPRQRKAQNGANRLWTGRVANTTTGSSTTQVVYKIPTWRRYWECEVLNYEVVWTSPVKVVIEWENVYRVSLDEKALQRMIENFEDFTLSNVTLSTVNWDVTFTGDITAEGVFTGTVVNADTINADAWTIDTLTSTDATITNLDATSWDIATLTSDSATITDLTTTGTATLATASVTWALSSWSLTTPTATITNLTATNGTITTLDASATTTGTLTVSWASTFQGNMTGNNATFTNVTVTGNQTVEWNTTLNNLNATWTTTLAWATVSGNLSVTGNETVTGNQTIAWTATFNNAVTVNDDLTVADDLTVNWTTHLTDLETTQSVDIGGTLRVDWAINGWNWMTITGQVESDTVRTGELIADEIRVQEGIYLSAWAEAPDFVLQAEKGQPNGVCPLNASWKVDPQYLPDVFTTAIVKVGTGIFSNSNTSVVVDSSITADSFVIISNYSDIIWDLNEVINVWQLTVVSNQTETGSYKYIIVNPLPVNP